MIIAKIIDNVWATRKADELNGLKFMLAEEIDGTATGKRLVAVDVIGAGIGDRVIISTGSSAREMIGRSVPVDAVVVGIIDEDCKLK
ncbi:MULTISPECIES: EutN/CcmL family microcompartment protein [Cetobacterium]|uniref:EutN/CcmL family microcompartment protein n=1 Tax=Cetobacterium TaxID=180162 RepID=UPI0022557EED|nr:MULTISPECIES: EutN/CcmL family microcompartment protein [Cetobacterium]MCX3066819.1 EutN/CcmL family microcompartment protein [Cetobacterium somerae]